MTESEETAAEDAAAEAPSDSRDSSSARRRRPAPPAHPFFQYLYPLLIVGAGIFVFLLWREGTKAVLDTTDGDRVEVVSDPTKPNFIAFAEPTPTLLIAHTDADDRLVGVTILARTLLDEGGSLVVFSPDMLVQVGEQEGVVLRQVYEDDGVEGLERVLGVLMGFGFTDDPMIIDEARLADFLELVEPIPLVLRDDLVAVDDEGVETIVIAAGASEFDGATLAKVFGWRNETEVDAARFDRQLAIWDTWLTQVGLADDLIAATLPFNDQLPPFLRSLGTGTADLSLPPVTPFAFDPDNPIYMLTNDVLDWPTTKSIEMVPWPIAPVAGSRPLIQLLDGTGDPVNRERLLPLLFAAGVQIEIVGNASTFDVATSTVSYHSPDAEDVARDLAEELGFELEFDEDINEPVDLTVTIGADG